MGMSIQVNDFRWEPGKNDVEYIRLLESSRNEWQKIAQKAIAKLKTNALELRQMPPQLSNNNAVAPHYKYSYGLDTACGNCGHEVDRYSGHKYCPHCGCLMDWENIMPYEDR